MKMIKVAKTLFTVSGEPGSKIIIDVNYEGDKKYLHKEFETSCNCVAEADIQDSVIKVTFKIPKDFSRKIIRFYEKDGKPLKVLNDRGVEVFNKSKTSHKIVLTNGNKS